MLSWLSRAVPVSQTAYRDCARSPQPGVSSPLTGPDCPDFRSTQRPPSPSNRCLAIGRHGTGYRHVAIGTVPRTCTEVQLRPSMLQQVTHDSSRGKRLAGDIDGDQVSKLAELDERGLEVA